MGLGVILGAVAGATWGGLHHGIVGGVLGVPLGAVLGFLGMFVSFVALALVVLRERLSRVQIFGVSVLLAATGLVVLG